MVPPLIVLLPVLFLGGIVSTISGGGLGIVLFLILNTTYDVRTSIIINSLLGFAIQGAKFAHFFRHTRWNIVGWYLLTGIPASVLGGVLFFFVPERLLEIAIGVLCLIFSGKELFRRSVSVSPRITTLLTAGFVNGLIGGVIGNAAVLRLSALLAFGLTKEQLIGTSSIIAIGLNVGKTSAYLQQFTWSPDVILVLVTSAPVILVSVAVGKRILKYVSPALFERLLLCIIFLGGIHLIFFP